MSGLSDDPRTYGNLFLSDDYLISEDGPGSLSSDITVDRSMNPSRFMDSDPPPDYGDMEDYDRRHDDSSREQEAIQRYEETHPDRQQKLTGGREIAELEAIWAVSTFRPDWGVEKMRDNNPLTYWQSESNNPKAPHTIDLYFQQATFIKQVSIFIDFFQDESYSPKLISIRGGASHGDLHEMMTLECGEIVGWVNADLISELGEPVRVFRLQIAILHTHMNGRDTHIRQLKVYSILPPYVQKMMEMKGMESLSVMRKGLR